MSKYKGWKKISNLITALNAEENTENYITGWIKVYRSFINWEWYDSSEMVHLFLHLILKASRRESKWRGLTIEKGQLITGRKRLAQELNMTEQKIRTYLQRLVDTEEITIKATNKFSVITICNYANYQQAPDVINQQNNQEITNKEPTNNHIQKVKKLRSNITNDLFEEFWDKYHRICQIPKTDRGAAEKHWRSLKPKERQRAIDSVGDYYQSIENKKYIQKARTYLSVKAFDNEFARFTYTGNPDGQPVN
jgi:hypothetical protein